MSLPHAILGVLATGPRHGHAVARELARLLDGLRPVNRGQVYATLARLTRQRLVIAAPSRAAGAGTRGTRPYALLPAGRRALRRWLDGVHVERTAPCGFVERLVVLHALGDADGLARLLAARRVRLDTLRDTLQSIDRRTRHDGASADLREAARRLVAAEIAWLADVERVLLPARAQTPEAWSARGA